MNVEYFTERKEVKYELYLRQTAFGSFYDVYWNVDINRFTRGLHNGCHAFARY
jgi:hypothetical protein